MGLKLGVSDILDNIIGQDIQIDENKKIREFFTSIFNNSGIGIGLVDLQGNIIQCNSELTEMLGYTNEELTKFAFSDITHKEDIDIDLQMFDELINNKRERYQLEKRYVSKSGNIVWVKLTVSLIHDENGNQKYVLGMVENITEEKILNEKLNETEEKFSLILENLPNGIIILSMKGNVLYINAAALKQLGVSEKEAYRRRYNDPAWNVYTLDGTPYYLAKLSFFASMRKRRPIKNLELMCRRKDGTDIVLSSNITTISSKGQTIPNILISLTDITQIKKAVQKAVELNFQLEKMSSLDGLTGIDNRRSFDEHMEIEWKRCLRESKSLSLIMIDIDHFKLFNDTYGHQGGDNCLKEVAETLGCLIKRPPDIVCRYGGEEFVIILPETDEEGARVVAERLRNGIQDLRILHAGSRVSKFVTISLGVASIIPNKYISANELIERADKALYKAKLDGRNRCSVYTSNY